MGEPILTLDAGTTGLKCTLFDETGEALAMAVSEYGVDMPQPGWAQQPTEWLIRAAVDGTRRALAAAGISRVAAIGLSGTMNGCIPIDGAGDALYPNIIHADVRAEPQLAEIQGIISPAEYYQSSGNRLDMHYTLPKMLWLRQHRPDVFRRARYFVGSKDILYGFLTGCHGLTDYSDASLTGAQDIHTGGWNEPLLRALAIDPGVMPDIRPSADVTGVLTGPAAQLLGLPQGTRVAIGAGDAACASHGAGLFAPGSAYINIGSSAWICTLSEKPVIDAGMRTLTFLDMDGKRWNVCGTVQSAGAALDWAMDNLLGLSSAKAESFALMEQLAQQVPPGAEGVFFLPTLMGERTPWWDAGARGALLGATLYHHRGHIARAVYEGIAQALVLCHDVLRENGLRYDESLALVGGGAKSRIWPQMLADMTGLPSRVHAQTRHATSLGAAMAAGVGVGIFGSYEEAAGMARFGAEYAPVPESSAAYARHFQVYKGLYGQIKEAYAAISAYQNQGPKEESLCN